MCDSHPVPKVFISLRLLLFRYESHIQNQTFPFFFLFFHSETKDTSYTPTISFLSFKLIHVEAEKYPFSQWFIPFRLLLSENVLKTQTIPFLFLVFHFEAKNTPSHMVLLPFHSFFVWCILFLKI